MRGIGGVRKNQKIPASHLPTSRECPEGEVGFGLGVVSRQKMVEDQKL